MMTIDKFGWRGESRPDIAAELARAASLRRNAALTKFQQFEDEKRSKSAAKARRNLIIGTAIAATLITLAIGFSIQQYVTMTDIQRAAVASTVY